MGSFYDVVNGNPTNAADVNQFTDRLNGNTASQVILLSTSNTAYALGTVFPSVPSSGNPASIQSIVTGDANPRIALYVRSADGYGGILGGVGGTPTSHMYATSGGWTFAEAVTMLAALTANALTITTTLSSDGGKLTTDGNGNLSGPAGGGIPTTRNGTATSVPVYTGTTTPSSPPTGSLWVKA